MGRYIQLSYRNHNGYYPYTEFDRFPGESIDPNVTENQPIIATLAIRLQIPPGYLTSGGIGPYGTDPFRMRQGTVEFFNAPKYWEKH
ncbi:MAG: hypothetical protein JXB19_07405 [Bacteroidales bacterium]|nr:hypothetical protein [Bacteroidales bacterium]